jgi:hypothetical protein
MVSVEWQSGAVTVSSFNIQHSTFNIPTFNIEHFAFQNRDAGAAEPSYRIPARVMQRVMPNT